MLDDFEKSERTVRKGISDNKGEILCFAYASGSCHTASDLNHPSCWIDALSINAIISMDLLILTNCSLLLSSWTSKEVSNSLAYFGSHKLRFHMAHGLELLEQRVRGSKDVLTRQSIICLHTLLHKNMKRARRIVAQRGVKKISEEPNGSSIFQRITGEE
ncbi:unnamed protein product [Lactuca saligna]|uniref:Uncharacterized protein n=1 Tax=Lactuca saligna TaxID=75948 RepID=A0AA35Y452_LACSI|nr:unnamed protein product [Lactuca saligna]